MNRILGLAPTDEAVRADNDLTESLKSCLSQLGGVVEDDYYDAKTGELINPPESELESRKLNEVWLEAYALLRNAYRDGLKNTQWAEILEIGLDYNYAPTSFKEHIAKYWRSVEAIVAGEEPELSGREAGVESLEVENASPRRNLVNILEGKKNKSIISRFKKACRDLVTEEGLSFLQAVKVVHSCNKGEESGNLSEYVGRGVCELFKLAKSDDEKLTIVAFIHEQWKARNLRGTIKKALMGFECDGVRPFPFVKNTDKDPLVESTKAAMTVNAGWRSRNHAR